MLRRLLATTGYSVAVAVNRASSTSRDFGLVANPRRAERPPPVSGLVRRFRVGDSSDGLLCRMGARSFDRQFLHPAAAFLAPLATVDQKSPRCDAVAMHDRRQYHSEDVPRPVPASFPE